MGDRANVCFKTEKGDARVFLYLHWGGTRLPQSLLLAMQSEPARARLNDPMYLTRILISRLIGPIENHMGETSFGIGTHVGDNEHPVFEVDVPAKKVTVYGFNEKTWNPDWSLVIKSWSFSEFISLESLNWNSILMDALTPE